MVFGVLILLPLALSEVGGLERATQEMAQMTPPRHGTITLQWNGLPSDSEVIPIRSGSWFLERDSQRNLNPAAQEKTIKRLSYLSTLIVGTLAMIGAVNPPDFLQDIIVYTGSGLAA